MFTRPSRHTDSQRWWTCSRNRIRRARSYGVQGVVPLPSFNHRLPAGTFWRAHARLRGPRVVPLAGTFWRALMHAGSSPLPLSCSGVRVPPLVFAPCQVIAIAGERLSAHLPMATRLILIKSDGSVSIHATIRAYKPLNWMSPPCTLVELGALGPDQSSSTERGAAVGPLGGPWTRRRCAPNLAGERCSMTPHPELAVSTLEYRRTAVRRICRRSPRRTP